MEWLLNFIKFSRILFVYDHFELQAFFTYPKITSNRKQRLSKISINLLTVYHASCILIGYSIRGLFVIAY